MANKTKHIKEDAVIEALTKSFYKGEKIVDLLIFKTIEEVREWRKENPDIHLKYDTANKIYHTLEQ